MNSFQALLLLPVRCFIWLRIRKLRFRLMEVLTPGCGSFWEQSSFSSWFSPLEFRDNLETVPDFTQTCGFRRNLSYLQRVPRTRLSVLLNSWDNFFVTAFYLLWHLTDIVLRVNPGTAASRDWLFLGCSFWISLAIAANFRLYLSVAVFERKNNRGAFKIDRNFLFFISNSGNQKM